jgi:hypothetical protein
MARTPKSRSKPDWEPLFLEHLANSGNIFASAKAAKITRSTVYERRDNDPEFKAAMFSAFEDATDLLELEARRRAHDGVDEPHFGSGGPGLGTVQVGVVRKYSDTLMSLLLKAHRPEKFRERYEVKHDGNVSIDIIETVVRTREEAAAVSDLPQAG